MRLASDLEAEAPALTIEELFRAHGDSVARWAARLGGPSLDVEDVVQEVFLLALKKLDSFRYEAKASTWLYGITARVVSTRRRKAWWRSSLPRPFSRSDPGEETLVDPTPSAAQQLETEEQRRRVYALLDTLPERQRTALILSELEGLSGDEVAELMGAKRATVFVWIHRAKARLAEQLEQLEGSP